MNRVPLPALTLLAVVLAACSGPPFTPDPAPPPAVIIPDTTKVADASARASLKTYDSASGVLRFSGSGPVLAKLKSGDVLVSEPSNAAPSGYLRKVTGVRQDGGDTVLDTTQARLDEAITEGELHADFQLSGDDMLRTEGLPEGVTLTANPANGLKAQAGKGANYNFSLNFDHTFVPIKGPTATGTIRVNGTVNFNVGYGVDVGIHIFSSPHLTFQASVGFAQSSNLNITGDFQGMVGDSLLIAVLFSLGFLMTMLFVVGAALAGYHAPNMYLYQKAHDRSDLIQRALPDAIDLLTISVESGLGFDAAVAQVSRNSEGPLADEFARMLQEMQIGRGRSDALRSMADRTDLPDLRTFVSAMVQADAFGIPVGQVLRVQSSEIRVKRRQWAEEMAQKVPVKILVPLVFCILPCLFIAVLGPAGITIMENFSGTMGG